MRNSITFLAIFGALYLAATGTRRPFLSDVAPIGYADALQSMWALDAAFLLRSLENIALLGFAALVVIAISQWIRNRGRPIP
jgi:hypothetical protein